MKFDAIILARGGSKKIPGKNLRLLNGKPLAYWSLAYALNCKNIRRIYLASDSEKILNISLLLPRVEIIKRSAKVSRDKSTDLETFKFLLKKIKKKSLSLPDYIVHLRPTNPIREKKWLEDMIKMIELDNTITCVRTIEPLPKTPFKMWKMHSNSKITPLLDLKKIPEAHSMPRQDLPKVYQQNAHIDIFKTKLISTNSLVGKNVKGYLTPSAIPDIDTLDDLKLARRLFSRYQNGKFLDEINSFSKQSKKDTS